MPDGLDPRERTHEFVRRLDDNFRHLRAVSKQFQDKLVLKQSSGGTPAESQAGDFVLFERDKSVPRPNKLSPDFLGPLSHNKNDVTTRNLV